MSQMQEWKETKKREKIVDVKLCLLARMRRLSSFVVASPAAISQLRRNLPHPPGSFHGDRTACAVRQPMDIKQPASPVGSREQTSRQEHPNRPSQAKNQTAATRGKR